MNTEPTQPTKEKFRPEGSGYELSMLDASYSPVYYGFNCRPRQVKYYKVENSVKDVLNGSVSKSVSIKFLEKVEKAFDKHSELMNGFQSSMNGLEELIKSCSSEEYYRKVHLREKLKKVEKKFWSDNHQGKQDCLKHCIEKLKEYINS
jgi:hypothetical protein